MKLSRFGLFAGLCRKNRAWGESRSGTDVQKGKTLRFRLLKLVQCIAFSGKDGMGGPDGERYENAGQKVFIADIEIGCRLATVIKPHATFCQRRHQGRIDILRAAMAGPG